MSHRSNTRTPLVRAGAAAAGAIVAGAALLGGAPVAPVSAASAANIAHLQQDIMLTSDAWTDYIKDTLDSWGIGLLTIPQIVDEYAPDMTIGDALHLLGPSISTATTLGQLMTDWNLDQPMTDYLSMFGFDGDTSLTLYEILGLEASGQTVAQALADFWAETGLSPGSTMAQVLDFVSQEGGYLDPYIASMLDVLGLTPDMSFASIMTTFLETPVGELFGNLTTVDLLGDLATTSFGDLLGYDATDATLVSTYLGDALDDLGWNLTVDELLGLTDPGDVGGAAALDALSALAG